MNKIVPEISSGHSRLLITETICFMSRHGVRISVPTANKAKGEVGVIGITFTFPEVPGPMGMAIHTDGNEVQIILSNFGGSLPSGITTPIGIQIDGTPIRLLFVGTALVNNQNQKDKMITLTVSVYQGEMNG
jgi:hypothetical protein